MQMSLAVLSWSFHLLNTSDPVPSGDHDEIVSDLGALLLHGKPASMHKVSSWEKIDYFVPIES